MLAWNTLFLRCSFKASLVGGILSTSLVICVNAFTRMRSTSLSSSDSLEYSVQTNFDAICFSPDEIMNVVSTTVANVSMRDGTLSIKLQQYRLPLNLKADVLSDPVKAWKRAMALHFVVPRFVAIVFREIILVALLALNEIQTSASGLKTSDVERIPQRVMPWSYISKRVYSKLAYGQQLARP